MSPETQARKLYAMASLFALGCFIFIASFAPVTSQEYFTIHSAVSTNKCLSVNAKWYIELADCEDELSESSQVWYWNQSWLVNRQLKYYGQAQCARFYDKATYEYHGRPLKLKSCEEGLLSMEWTWEDGRIKHSHSSFCFDLPGPNFTDFDVYVAFTSGNPPIQLGAIDFSSDQRFITRSVPGTPAGYGSKRKTLQNHR